METKASVILEPETNSQRSTARELKWPIDHTLKVPMAGLAAFFASGILSSTGSMLAFQVATIMGLILFLGGLLAVAVHSHLILLTRLPARVGDAAMAASGAIHFWIQVIVIGGAILADPPIDPALFYILWGMASIVLSVIFLALGHRGRSNAWYLHLPTVDEYLAKNQMHRNIACRKCGSRHLRNWGWANRRDQRRFVRCGSCEANLYRIPR